MSYSDIEKCSNCQSIETEIVEENGQILTVCKGCKAIRWKSWL